MSLKRSQDKGFGFSRPAAIPLEATRVASESPARRPQPHSLQAPWVSGARGVCPRLLGFCAPFGRGPGRNGSVDQRGGWGAGGPGGARLVERVDAGPGRAPVRRAGLPARGLAGGRSVAVRSDGRGRGVGGTAVGIGRPVHRPWWPCPGIFPSALIGGVRPWGRCPLCDFTARLPARRCLPEPGSVLSWLSPPRGRRRVPGPWSRLLPSRRRTGPPWGVGAAAAGREGARWRSGFESRPAVAVGAEVCRLRERVRCHRARGHEPQPRYT